MSEEKNKKKLREDVKRILKDIQELNKDIGETGEEIEETGEDVEEIKEDIEEIKEDLGTLKKTMFKGKEIFSRVATKVLPDRFAFKDIAQQIVGATILSSPFAVTEEVWNLARNLSVINIFALIIITILFDILLFYYTKYYRAEEKKFLELPKRIISLLIVTYAASAIVLSVFGVIGGQIQDPSWAMRLIVMVGLFANIGAGTADLIR
jgi:uncharacterized membrane protein|tara:strand:- start:49 stop:672 length:624 start_codon:yes stop_codon:yes gene_type:complete